MARAIAVAVIVVGLILIVPTAAAAQGGASVKAGVAISKGTGPQPTGETWLTAFTVGLSAAVPLATNVFFQPEVFWTRKGDKFEEDSTTAKVKLDYIEIPLLLRFSSSEDVGADIFGGIAPAFRVRARMSIGTGSTSVERDISDTLNRADVGVVVGGGVHAGRVSGEVRWTEGLLNAIKNAGPGEKVRNRTIAFIGGIRF